ncbi:CRAL-TRIO domain-containing protein, partial [Dunaliella salina]
MLRRFLKARQWDVAGAQQMWMDMLEFRALYNVDRILTDFQFTEREEFLDAYPHGLHKVDRKFRPVMVYKFGAVDLDRLKAVTTDERITLFHIQEYERIMNGVLPACSLASGHYVEQLFTLIDVAGLKMKDMMRVKDLLTGYIKVDSNNYPETLGAMVIINAPYWFSGMFSAIKSFLPPETQKKVQ